MSPHHSLFVRTCAALVVLGCNRGGARRAHTHISRLPRPTTRSHGTPPTRRHRETSAVPSVLADGERPKSWARGVLNIHTAHNPCPGGLCFPDPTSAGGSFPPSRAGGFLRRERPVVEERRRARAACDLEGNRAGLGCLEHLGNALSFAVVTEWPVRVYPRHRCRSPPQACLV